MKNYILTQQVAEKKLRRMANEIMENNSGERNLILAGIRESGSAIARRRTGRLRADAGTAAHDPSFLGNQAVPSARLRQTVIPRDARA